MNIKSIGSKIKGNPKMVEVRYIPCSSSVAFPIS